MTNVTLFSQMISKLDRNKFSKLVSEMETDKHHKGYDSWTHLVSMLFCQFAKSQSVRDISNGLRSATGNLNHLVIPIAPSKSTIINQNKHRDWELFRAYYYCLLDGLGQQAALKQVKFKIKSKIFLLDSTTISCSTGLNTKHPRELSKCIRCWIMMEGCRLTSILPMVKRLTTKVLMIYPCTKEV